MNEAIFCRLSPVKTLAVSAAPLRELSNFLIYSRHSELLNERARRQPTLFWEKTPRTTKELGIVLRAESRDKNGKLFFDCERSENQLAVLLDNHGAQFWVHYFRCGVGLVNLSFFNHLASVEGSLTNRVRSITHTSEFQWFAHDLRAEFFGGEAVEMRIRCLGDYFVERVNSALVYPYSIYSENPQMKEPCRFVSGSLERLKEVLIWARCVCEGLKREKESNGKIRLGSYATINCGNLRDAPSLECADETFLNAVGALAVKENAPYTVLNESYARRADGECYDWARKNKHRIFLNLEQEAKDIPVRLKIAARGRLISWLAEQGFEGERILKTWKLRLSD